MDFVEREVYLKSHLAVDDKSRIYRRMLSVMVCIVGESIVKGGEKKVSHFIGFYILCLESIYNVKKCNLRKHILDILYK